MGFFLSKNEHEDEHQHQQTINTHNDIHQTLHEFNRNTNEINSLKDEIKLLQKENNSLREYNDQLKDKLLTVTTPPPSPSNNQKSIEKIRLTDISMPHLDAFIENMLKDKSINIKYLPDFVEEAIYRNVFSMTLRLFDHILETSKVSVLGQEINFDLKAPSQNNDDFGNEYDFENEI